VSQLGTEVERREITAKDDVGVGARHLKVHVGVERRRTRRADA